jgi:hypothetical protein
VFSAFPASAADRGPSTPEERKQALDYIQDFEANPLGPRAIQEREWTMRWIIEVPDIHVSACLFIKLPKGDKKDSNTLFAAMFMSQTAFAIQNLGKPEDRSAEYEAGTEGLLRVYEVLLKNNPKDRQPELDDLLQKRDSGTLAKYVQERSAAECKK